MIVSQNDYDLKENSEDRVSFVNKFTGWIIHLGKNIKDLTGEATKQEWLPQEKNETDSIK